LHRDVDTRGKPFGLLQCPDEASRWFSRLWEYAVFRNLDRRDLQPEIMDGPDVELGRHKLALAGLARVNNISRVAAGLWRPIRDLAQRLQMHELSVLDVASGGGDIGLALFSHAQRDGVRLHLTGYDYSHTAVEQARRRAKRQNANAEFQVRDVLTTPFERQFDVVLCTLFLHHLDEARAVLLLNGMKQSARRLLAVNDLERSRLGYVAAKLVCPIISRSDIVHLDGPQSVAAAFRISEAQALTQLAGLDGARWRRVWPFRFLVTWEPGNLAPGNLANETSRAALTGATRDASKIQQDCEANSSTV